MLVGCRHAALPTPLPADWATLVLPAPSYRALYRLSCCGRRDLVAALRGSAGVVHLSVAAPPAGSLVEAWLEGRSGALLDVERRCRIVLPPGELPLGRELSLPLAPGALALLVSGRLPAAVVPVSGRPGWVEGPVDGAVLRVRVAGSPPRATALEVAGQGGSGPLLAAVMSAHRGLVPGVLDVQVGERALHLELQVWEQGAPPGPPAWGALPPCGGAS